jgi:Holliday junction resolvase RusA-like endonuclease
MNSWALYIPGKPTAKPRPRLGGTHVYTPKDDRDFVGHIRLKAWEAGVTLTDGPVGITIFIDVAMPKSWSKKKRREMDGEFATCKPDGDNVEKNVWDALTGISHKDDAQVARWTGLRMWGDRDETCIIVRHLTGVHATLLRWRE